jgi:hypothetical protein
VFEILAILLTQHIEPKHDLPILHSVGDGLVDRREDQIAVTIQEGLGPHFSARLELLQSVSGSCANQDPEVGSRHHDTLARPALGSMNIYAQYLIWSVQVLMAEACATIVGRFSSSSVCVY